VRFVLRREICEEQKHKTKREEGKNGGEGFCEANKADGGFQKGLTGNWTEGRRGRTARLRIEGFFCGQSSCGEKTDP